MAIYVNLKKIFVMIFVNKNKLNKINKSKEH